MTKKKILVISDHPLSPSGVGTQTKYMIEALLQTGRYQFICLGGAIKHASYELQKVEPWGEDWRIFPIDGYGNHETIRSILIKEKPDVLWFMTDPRFYGWLWEIENEIRVHIPMVYYHVWDNYPYPIFNSLFYRSTDEVACISKVTHSIVKNVAEDVSSFYLPHAVDDKIFYPFRKNNAEEMAAIAEIRQRIVSSSTNFKTLLMHTDPRDPNGQDLPHLIQHLGVDNGQVLLSTDKVDARHLAAMYNASDFTINISDAEGFGLATLESLSCGTPIIVNMTGGLQEQVTDGTNWFGYGIQPSSKAVIGSLQVPYIYEDRMSQEDFEKSLSSASSMRPKVYKEMCKRGKQHVMNNYNFSKYQERWVNEIDRIVEEHGSWDTRKNYKRWHLMEVA